MKGDAFAIFSHHEVSRMTVTLPSRIGTLTPVSITLPIALGLDVRGRDVCRHRHLRDAFPWSRISTHPRPDRRPRVAFITSVEEVFVAHDFVPFFLLANRSTI
jgi:hypothetical protein